ncbi:G-protein coupled receptor moody-like [Amphiura filiformis]|uniref:G-protein coupled receptor moody-like n=1 Tax=Amphiura filiformis TaxID=82378 RepID=UPI003B20B792
MNLSAVTDAANTTSDKAVPLDVYYAEQVLHAIILAFISFLGITGNSMIILAVLFSRKLQTSTNAFVISLSVADLLTSIFFIFMIVAVLGEGMWLIPGANWLCQLTGFIVYTCTGTSLYTLGVIALNRLVLITKPHLYPKMFTMWKLAVWVAVPWFIPVCANFAAISTGLGGYGYDNAQLACVAVLNARNNSMSLSLYTALIGFPVPFLTITICYVRIYLHVKKHFRERKQALQHSNGIGITQDTPNDRKSIKISRDEIEITKNLFLVVCAFLICFLPFFFLISIPGINVNHELFYIRLMTNASSAINFFIYTRKHPDFRQVLGHMMRCSYSKIPQPSRVLKRLLPEQS